MSRPKSQIKSTKYNNCTEYMTKLHKNYIIIIIQQFISGHCSMSIKSLQGHNVVALTGVQRTPPTETANHAYRRTHFEQTRWDHSYAVYTQNITSTICL